MRGRLVLDRVRVAEAVVKSQTWPFVDVLLRAEGVVHAEVAAEAQKNHARTLLPGTPTVDGISSIIHRWVYPRW